LRPAWAEINLEAVARNIATLRKLVEPDALFMAVVKADGYGHGAIPVSRTALKSGADRLGVALVEEAIELREQHIHTPIHILSEIPPETYEASRVATSDLIPTVCQMSVAEKLSRAAVQAGRGVKVHIKVDTGMNRLGIPADPERVVNFVRQVQDLPNLEVEGIFTHFALADKPQSDFTDRQFERFQRVIESLEDNGIKVPIKHAANSAAIMTKPQTHLDMVRAGISIYGLPPSPELSQVVRLKPALSLKTKISYLKRVPVGEGISYGLTYRTDKPTLIATLPIGYADGYSRSLSNRSEVLVRGKRARVAGTICMDQFMVDVNHIPNVKVGEEVTLIGRQKGQEITADEIAKLMGTINYEVVCAISKRVPRVYV
jgi:alanine racemase